MTTQSSDLSIVETLHATSLQREIEFVAKGTSEAVIEFYSWDFNYKADEQGDLSPCYPALR
jgi:hypothetical protein